MRPKNYAMPGIILKSIDEFFDRHDRTPSLRELGEICGKSHITVSRCLREMHEKGILEYEGGEIVTERMIKLKPESVTVPILGSISCGTPIIEEENIESYVKLPVELVGHGDFFFLKANGDSMIEAGIDDGDFVLVRKTTEAKDGDIVVALVDNENTLKRLYHDDKRCKIVLHPENKEFDDMVLDYCEIQGVAVKVLKDLQSEQL